VTATFIGGQQVFGLEMQPDEFQDESMTLTLEVGNPLLTLTQIVNGEGGAKFFGWISDVDFTSMTLIDNSGDFAFGRMAVPVPPSVLLLGSGLLGLIAFRRKFLN